MAEGGYKIRNKEGIYFVTFAVVERIDVFTRSAFRDIVVERLKYIVVQEIIMKVRM